MIYKITNKVTLNKQDGLLNTNELNSLLDTFISFNGNKKFNSLDDKIKYYNKKSFYTIEVSI